MTNNQEAEIDLQIDHDRPLHLQASDTPSAALIPMKLTGLKNYRAWNRSMYLALLLKNKLGFIYDTYLKSSYKRDLAIWWEGCDTIVLSWISNAVASWIIDEHFICIKFKEDLE